MKQTAVIETKPVSREMLSELRLRQAEKDRAIAAINNQIQDKQTLAREVHKLQIEISQKESDLSKMPASVDVSSEVNALAEKRAQLNELLRQSQLRQEERDYHDKLEKETRETVRKMEQEKAYNARMHSPNTAEAIAKYADAKRSLDITEKDLDFAKSKETMVHNLMKQHERTKFDNALKEKEIEKMADKKDVIDSLTDDLVANQADATAKKRILGLKEQTHKAARLSRKLQAFAVSMVPPGSM